MRDIDVGDWIFFDYSGGKQMMWRQVLEISKYTWTEYLPMISVSAGSMPVACHHKYIEDSCKI
jgi:hypothetical protein